MRPIDAAVGLVAFLAVATSAQPVGRACPSPFDAAFSRLPIHFIENRGVYPDEVAYYVPGADKTLFFTKGGATIRMKDKHGTWVVKLEFVGANPNVRPRGEDRQPAVFSYFRGPAKDWNTGLGTWARVVYEDLWPGIDLVYTGAVDRLKYEFVVRPGADPGKIRLRYRGAPRVEATESGGVRVETPAGRFEDAPPVAWQCVSDGKKTVAVAHALEPAGTKGAVDCRFRVGAYDPTRTLVIDPLVYVYCGFIGGVDDDGVYGTAVDAAGCAYIIGWTESQETSFPVVVGPDLTYNGPGRNINWYGDVFVAKLSASGTTLIYCGYLGGSGGELPGAIAVDRSGNAYVTGETRSTEATFPVLVGPDLTYNGGDPTVEGDAFVAKIDPTGTQLLYCGYIGGSWLDRGWGIAIDAAGSAYVTGGTSSDQSTFPVKVGPDLTYNGPSGTPRGPNGDVFVAKVNPAGTGLVYCGYIGGDLLECGQAIAVDPSGNAYVTGFVSSTEATFPVWIGPDLTFNGGWFPLPCDAFVAKVNQGGTHLDYCGYIGGAENDFGQAIALDVKRDAYVAGWTESDEKSFPVVTGPDLTFNGGSGDAFVAKVGPSGAGLAYCGYIGGIDLDWGNGIAVDANDRAWVVGMTASDERTFPVLVGPDLTFNGYADGFVCRVDATGATLEFCGYLGGSLEDECNDITLDTNENAVLGGRTKSTESTFPVLAGPDLTYNGMHSGQFGGDGFVAKIGELALRGSGLPRLGGRVDLHLTSPADFGRPYQLGSSLGTGPILLGSRAIGLSLDALLTASVGGVLPSVFENYAGKLDTAGKGSAAINIPAVSLLVGQRIHTAFVTLDPAAPEGIRSISNTYMFTIVQ